VEGQGDIGGTFNPAPSRIVASVAPGRIGRSISTSRRPLSKDAGRVARSA
jgi:hypothetical protein